MTAQHLKGYAVTWACPHAEHERFGAELGLDRGQAVVAVNRAMGAFAPLSVCINNKLKKLKATTSPPISTASSELALFEGPGMALTPIEKGKPYHLQSRFYFDPLRLLGDGFDHDQLGTLAVEIAQEMCSIMRDGETVGFLTGFPFAAFEDAIADYTNANFMLETTSTARPLENSALKVRYRYSASPLETKVTLVLLKGRTPLWERDVRSLPAGALDNAATWTTFEGDKLRIRGMLPESVEPSQIILIDELPAEVCRHL